VLEGTSPAADGAASVFMDIVKLPNRGRTSHHGDGTPASNASVQWCARCSKNAKKSGREEIHETQSQ